MNNEIENNVPQITVPEEVKPIAKRGRGRPAKVEKAIFVEMWNKATSLSEVSVLLGMSKASCSVRASNLRKQGCELRPFQRGRKKMIQEEVAIQIA